MLEFRERANLYRSNTEHLKELISRVQAVFDTCVSFIENARREGEKTTIFYVPFLSLLDYHSTNIDPDTQVGVELLQSGPRNKPIRICLHVISPVQQEPYEEYKEEYSLERSSGRVMYANSPGDRYQPLSASDLEIRLPLLEKVAQKLVTPRVSSSSWNGDGVRK